MSIGQKLQDENTHTLSFGVDCVLLVRAQSVGLIGRPGDRARHTGESDLTRLLLSRAIILNVDNGFPIFAMITSRFAFIFTQAS